MKKILYFLIIVSLFHMIESCNLCWGYPKGSKHFSQIPMENLKNCLCECQKYPHSVGSDHAYVCTNCGHRITPPEILFHKKSKKKQNLKTPRFSYKRWQEKAS